MPYPDDFSSGRFDEVQGRDDAAAEFAQEQEDLAIEHSAWRTLERAMRELQLLTPNNTAIAEELSEIINELESARNAFASPNRWCAERAEVRIFGKTKLETMLYVLGKYYTAPGIGWARARDDGWNLYELPL